MTPSYHSSGLFQPHPGVEVEYETTDFHTSEGLIQTIPTSFRITPTPPYDEGGFIPGPADSVPAHLAPGEYIITPDMINNPLENLRAAITAAGHKFGELAEAMSGWSGGFATGGLVRSPSAAEPDPDDDYPTPPPVWNW